MIYAGVSMRGCVFSPRLLLAMFDNVVDVCFFVVVALLLLSFRRLLGALLLNEPYQYISGMQQQI